MEPLSTCTTFVTGDQKKPLSTVLFGDVKPVGEGVSELRIHQGAGYRLYLSRRGEAIVLLLCGGDKDSQERDIVRAKQLAQMLAKETDT